jgi:hypothetical protein
VKPQIDLCEDWDNDNPKGALSKELCHGKVLYKNVDYYLLLARKSLWGEC